MHEFTIGQWAKVLPPFDDAHPEVYRVVAVVAYDDPDTPEGVIDQTVSLAVPGHEEARDFANKWLELADEPVVVPGVI